MKRDAIAIFRAALAAADPEQSTTKALKAAKLNVSAFERVFLVAIGKAAIGMAAAVELFLGKRLTQGIALTKQGHAIGNALQKTAVFEAAHPIPNSQGVDASDKIERLLRTLNARDLLITAISGGASALLAAPAAGISLEDKQKTTELMLRAGADIFELNAVRKHLSRLKGGYMAKLAYPASVICLLLSDVIGDRIDVIGSGPLAPDTSTIHDALRALEKYGLTSKVPSRILSRLTVGNYETPKPSDPIFRNVRYVITASNRQALGAAAGKARALGYRPLVLSSSIQGEAREVARVHASLLRDAPPGSCLLTGGETTVTVKGPGKGGRNQEFALALAIDLAGTPGVLALCAGTDGTDGPTDAAGGIVAGQTVTNGTEATAFLNRNDSYRFLSAKNALLKTGVTGTNVMDINVLLSAQKS